MNRFVAITGGPGAGKTTVVDLFNRTAGDRIKSIPEIATLLFGNGFPRNASIESGEITQKAIFDLQYSFEESLKHEAQDRVILCDRALLDCMVYWKYLGLKNSFVSLVNTSKVDLLDRYDAVLFFESAACIDEEISTGNSVRNESREEAVKLNELLHNAWSEHPNFTYIKAKKSFADKIYNGMNLLNRVVEEL